MAGLTALPSFGARGRTLVLLSLLAIAGLLCVFAPSPARAAGCTDSWVAKGSGSWFVAANWSTKAVPTASDEVCITESAGSYTVEMDQPSAVTVKSLTLGGSANTQTLVVASTNSAHAVLTTTAGISIGAHGAMTLTNAETAGNNVTVVGPISNAGTISSEAAHGGQRNLQGNLTNTGTLAINTTTSFNGAKAALTNQGTISLATGVSLVVSNEGSATNGTGGKIVATGTGDVQVEPGCSFTEGAGTTSGSKPVILRRAALKYTGAGASLITLHGEGNTLSGNIANGQSLVLETINSEHVTASAAASYTNAGSITLTSAETAGNHAFLETTSGTLTNSGTISSESTDGGPREISGNLTNTGTLAINQTTAFNGAKAALINEGTIDVATGVQLVVSNEGSATNGTGGKIVAGEGAAVDLESGTSFTEGAGTTSGTKPVILTNAALAYTGSGASLITQRGEGSTLSGNISAGQKLVLETINSAHVKVTAAAGFTNAGTITLTKAETAANNAQLVVSTGTLTNTGTITTELSGGGVRALLGNLINKGTLAIDSNTSYDGAATTLTNEGAIDIATAVELSVSGNSTVSNDTGGMIAATGTGALFEVEGTFNEGLGKTTTAKASEPVILSRVALNYTGKGASKIAQRGASTLSGEVGKGQTLLIQSSCSAHAEDTAAGSFVNSGTIYLTNAETCGNNVTLKLAGGTLDNKGKLEVLYPHGGARTIEGSLVNEKTLTLANGQALKVTGSFSQGTKATTKITIAGASNFGALSVSGSVALAGKLTLKQSKFTAKAGESFAIVSGASRTGEFSSVTGNAIKKTTLHYVPHYTATGVNLIVE